MVRSSSTISTRMRATVRRLSLMRGPRVTVRCWPGGDGVGGRVRGVRRQALGVAAGHHCRASPSGRSRPVCQQTEVQPGAAARSRRAIPASSGSVFCLPCAAARQVGMPPDERRAATAPKPRRVWTGGAGRTARSRAGRAVARVNLRTRNDRSWRGQAGNRHRTTPLQMTDPGFRCAARSAPAVHLSRRAAWNDAATPDSAPVLGRAYLGDRKSERPGHRRPPKVHLIESPRPPPAVSPRRSSP